MSLTKEECRDSIAVARPDDDPHEGHGRVPGTGVHRTVFFALDDTSGLKRHRSFDDF
jgi:hypothetical protein